MSEEYNFDASKPEALGILKKQNVIQLEGAFVRTKTKPEFLVRSSPMQEINPKDIRAVAPAKGDLNGYVPVSIIEKSNPAAAQLIRKAPLFQCVGHYYETADDYWFSYRPGVGEAELQAICDSEEAPSEELKKKLTSKPGVYSIEVGVD